VIVVSANTVAIERFSEPPRVEAGLFGAARNLRRDTRRL
jgi:hypothetical protein